MKRVFQRPYLFWMVGIFLLYLSLVFILSGFYNTLQLLFIYAPTVNWFKLSLSLFFSLAIGALVAINVVYLYILYKRRQRCASAKTLTGIGATAGVITGICPLCVTGLFPLLLGFFGISFSFGSLPFQGIEVQVITLVILFLSLSILQRQNHGQKT